MFCPPCRELMNRRLHKLQRILLCRHSTSSVQDFYELPQPSKNRGSRCRRIRERSDRFGRSKKHSERPGLLADRLLAERQGCTSCNVHFHTRRNSNVRQGNIHPMEEASSDGQNKTLT